MIEATIDDGGGGAGAADESGDIKVEDDNNSDDDRNNLGDGEDDDSERDDEDEMARRRARMKQRMMNRERVEAVVEGELPVGNDGDDDDDPDKSDDDDDEDSESEYVHPLERVPIACTLRCTALESFLVFGKDPVQINHVNQDANVSFGGGGEAQKLTAPTSVSLRLQLCRIVPCCPSICP